MHEATTRTVALLLVSLSATYLGADRREIGMSGGEPAATVRTSRPGTKFAYERKKLFMEDPEIIHRYTRDSAMEDGVLVDVTVQARETGVLLPTAITAHLHEVLENIPAKSAGQDCRGRLHDVLWLTFLKLKSMQTKQGEEFPVEVNVFIDGSMQAIWAVIDGDGLTIMYPEDY